MQQDTSLTERLASEIAKRLGEIAAGRERLVVFVEQRGTSPAAAETRTAVERLLATDTRIVLARLANGVSVPERPPGGRGYSEAIGMRIPTPAPDVTVQIVETEAAVEVFAVMHTGPSSSQALFHLRFPE